MKPEHKKYISENIGKKSIKDIALDLNLKERKIKKYLEGQKQEKIYIDSAEEIKDDTKKWVIFIFIALIIISGFAVYVNSLNAEFVWDDYHLVKDNVFIKDWSNISKVFTKDIAAGLGGAGIKYNFYRPLQMFTYMLDYSLWGLNVQGYRLTNILLHISAALCIYWLISILYRNAVLSFFASILFIVHPIHTEAVTYISGRADSLATIFMLLCFIFYIKRIELKRLFLLILMVASFVLAILSKEYILFFPILLLLYHYTFDKKLEVKEFSSLTVIALAYILIRLTVLRSLLPHISSQTTLPQRLPGLFVAITDYTRLILLPLDLHMEYGKLLFNFSNPKAIFGLAITCALLIYAFQKREKGTLIFFSIAWFFLTLLPVSNIYPINAYMAEHFLYVPSIGFFLIFASVLTYLYRNKGVRIVAIVLVVSLLVFYSYLTIRQNTYWKDQNTLYNRTLKYASHSARTLNSLGTINEESGNYEQAITLYKKAIEADPNYADTYNNLGILYSKIGRSEEAIDLFKKAIEIKPNMGYAYNNLGSLYRVLGNYEEAIALYKKAIEMDPNYTEARANLAATYDEFKSGKKIIETEPNQANVFLISGNSYRERGNYEVAISLYEKAIEADPNYADAYSRLGAAYVAVSKYKEAIPQCKKAIEINQNDAMAHNNLAVAYYYEKEYRLAIKHCDRARELGLKIHPEFLKLLEPFR